MMYTPPTISRSNWGPVDTIQEAPPTKPRSAKGHVETIQLKSSTISISRSGITEKIKPKTNPVPSSTTSTSRSGVSKKIQQKTNPAPLSSTKRTNSSNITSVDKNAPKVQSVPLDVAQRLALQECVRCAGQRILFTAFNLLFKGDLYSMKKCFKEHGFTNNMYKDTFNNSERMKLDKGVAGSWDMPLLYKVLQRVCGLSEHDDSCWTKDKAGVDGESIEFLIFSTKEICGRIIHSNDISQHQVKTQLADLKSVFTKITRKFMRRDKERQNELEDLKIFFEETLQDFLPKK